MPSRFTYQPVRVTMPRWVAVANCLSGSTTAQFVHNEWIESYDPTIEDSYRTQVTVDGRQVVLEILDTAGTDQFVAMRDLFLKSGQGFLLVFSIASRSSFDELATLREEILRIKDDDTVPIVMVGNKADLEDQRAVDRARAFGVSRSWNAPYYESSARTRTNVDEVFIDICRQLCRREDMLEEQARDALGQKRSDEAAKKRRRRRRRKEKCVIL
ncbi:Putative protein similar to Krev-1 of Neurospora crassa [Podospora comata]|uniref:Ras-related protein n=1 Tax=Podospora comata TaxID=48703 RepID=A0ABY6RYL7_PODCO|nr:Putative protein similar to Krev-1 of Neurospora crassa [Podospora comata]